MRRIETAELAREFVNQHRLEKRTVGLVLTMGALHEGHLSLAHHSLAQCDVTVATIYLNPAQFGPQEDLDQYPRTLTADCELLQSIGVDAVFVPPSEGMYPSGFSTYVQPPDVALRWEGECRPEHFRGVTTVVLKFFHLLPASHAFFGRKDYQQLKVIQAMVRDLNVDIEIVGCETVREGDSLAMSSRNRYLAPDARQRAIVIPKALHHLADVVAAGQRDVEVLQRELQDILLDSVTPESSRAGVDQIDYAVIVDRETLEPMLRLDRPAVALIAARIGGTRLIDNRLIAP